MVLHTVAFSSARGLPSACLQGGHGEVVNVVRRSGSARSAVSQCLSLLAFQLASSYFEHKVSFEEHEELAVFPATALFGKMSKSTDTSKTHTFGK